PPTRRTRRPGQVTPSLARTWTPSSLPTKSSTPQHVPKLTQSLSSPPPPSSVMTTSTPIWAFGFRRSHWKLLLLPPAPQISTHELHHKKANWLSRKNVLRRSQAPTSTSSSPPIALTPSLSPALPQQHAFATP